MSRRKELRSKFSFKSTILVSESLCPRLNIIKGILVVPKRLIALFKPTWILISLLFKISAKETA